MTTIAQPTIAQPTIAQSTIAQSTIALSDGVIRKLWMPERRKLADHLLRLDPDSRRLRFAHGVSDAFVADYVAGVTDLNSVVYGWFIGPQMHAAAELRKTGRTWGVKAEAAFSVEREFQGLGIGSELMGLLIRAARNRAVHQLEIVCLAENGKMRRIAAKHAAVLRCEFGEMTGQIAPRPGNIATLLDEAVDDQRGYLRMILDLNARLSPTAVA